MARKNKDRDGSRKATGGLRETRRVTDIRRVQARRERDAYSSPALSGQMFSPDLSAFEHVDIIDPNRELSRHNNIASGYRNAGPRDLTPSRYKQASLQDMRRPGAAISLQDRKPTAAFGGQKLETANRVVSHEVRPKAREVSVRSNCKERPTDNRPRGGGGGKTFVPWCDRKRR